MALPNTSDMSKWSGSKFTNTEWDGNVDATVDFLTNGDYDANINNLECNAITANSISVPLANTVPTGAFQWWMGSFSPSGWIETDGFNILIAEYSDLFTVTGHTYGFGDGTETTADGISISGNVCTVTEAAHGLSDGDKISIKFTVTASGKVINVGVTISNVSTNTFDFSIATFTSNPEAPLVYVGDATTFTLLDSRGYAFRGVDTSATIDPDAGTRTNRGDGTTGAQVGTKQEDQFKAHEHDIYSEDDALRVGTGDGSSTGDIGTGDNNIHSNSNRYFKAISVGGNQTNIVNIAATGIIKT